MNALFNVSCDAPSLPVSVGCLEAIEDVTIDDRRRRVDVLDSRLWVTQHRNEPANPFHVCKVSWFIDLA
jgi:hypothetical protein